MLCVSTKKASNGYIIFNNLKSIKQSLITIHKREFYN